MNNQVSKTLMRIAKQQTVGKPASVTKKTYKALKKQYEASKRL